MILGIENRYIDAVAGEQALVGLNVGEGGDNWADNDWSWDVQGWRNVAWDSRNEFEDLSGYIV